MRLETKNVRITGISAAVPKFSVSNHEIGDKIFGRDFVDRTGKTVGPKKTHFANPNILNDELGKDFGDENVHSSGDLGIIAAKNLIKNMGIDPRSIDALCFNSQTPDFVVPPTAYRIADELNMSEDIYVYDTTHGCAGFVLSLMPLFAAIEKDVYKNALLITSEVHTSIIDRSDRETALIFSDAAAATFIERSEEESKAVFLSKIDGSHIYDIYLPSYKKINDERVKDKTKLFMDGEAVARYVMKNIPPILREAMELYKTSVNGIDDFLFHQANAFMNRFIAKRTHIEKEKIPVNIGEFGNTSAVSIPLLIADKEKAVFGTGESASKRVLLCGYGSGLVIAAGILDLKNLKGGEILFV
jgi:3-oxoacyl-[acyl-carrier-protein] synthase-3